ncbi:uncharacterized, partial [Tachysurus ichikawai]
MLIESHRSSFHRLEGSREREMTEREEKKGG